MFYGVVLCFVLSCYVVWCPVLYLSGQSPGYAVIWCSVMYYLVLLCLVMSYVYLYLINQRKDIFQFSQNLIFLLEYPQFFPRGFK